MLRNYRKITPGIHPFGHYELWHSNEILDISSQGASQSVSGLGSLATPIKGNLSLCFILCVFLFFFSILVLLSAYLSLSEEYELWEWLNFILFFIFFLPWASPWWDWNLHVPHLCQRGVISRLSHQFNILVSLSRLGLGHIMIKASMLVLHPQSPSVRDLCGKKSLSGTTTWVHGFLSSKWKSQLNQ